MSRDDAAIQSVTASEAPTRSNNSDRGLRLNPSPPAFSFDSGDLLVNRESGIGNEGINRLLTVAEVAALLNVPRRWVYRRVGLKPPDGIPHAKVGKYVRFRQNDLQDYVERPVKQFKNVTFGLNHLAT
ncbi:MAG TPA: helix-turn-helix domain-containing protein [Terriglobia bacterium]|nr:helix-turn-helix domain-containing protein [Terriglobia bacterium]